MKLGDAKGAVAAYKRAVGEAVSPDLALLQGLADALTADAREQEAVDFLSAQQPGSRAGLDVVDLQLLIGKVQQRMCFSRPMAAFLECSPACASSISAAMMLAGVHAVAAA